MFHSKLLSLPCKCRCQSCKFYIYNCKKVPQSMTIIRCVYTTLLYNFLHTQGPNIKWPGYLCPSIIPSCNFDKIWSMHLILHYHMWLRVTHYILILISLFNCDVKIKQQWNDIMSTMSCGPNLAATLSEISYRELYIGILFWPYGRSDDNRICLSFRFVLDWWYSFMTFQFLLARGTQKLENYK